MRDLLLGIAIPVALIWALFSAPVSVLVLNWIWFQRPYDFSWGFWNQLPMFQVALGVALVSNLARGTFRLRMPAILGVYLALMCWITLSAMFAYDTERAWDFYGSYAPSMWAGPIFVFAVIADLKLLKAVLWTAVGGIGLNGVKTGLSLAVQGGGHLTDQITGFVGDNNVFGLVLCLIIAMLFGLRSTLPDRKPVRLGYYFCMACVVACILFTKSRGALVSLCIIALVASLLGSRPIRNLMITATAICLTYWLTPAEYFDRLSTLSELSSDESAMGRLQNWRLSWQEAQKFPLFGVGPDNHIPYNRALQSDVQVRVAHSVYLQTLGELGFPGLLLYLAFLLIGMRQIWRTWRKMIKIAQEHPDLAWVRNLAFWTFCGLVGFVAGAGLLNMLYIEFPFYAIFYGCMLLPLVERELAVRRGENVDSAARPALIRRKSASGDMRPQKPARRSRSMSTTR